MDERLENLKISDQRFFRIDDATKIIFQKDKNSSTETSSSSPARLHRNAKVFDLLSAYQAKNSKGKNCLTKSILFYGVSGVGKSCLLKSLEDGYFSNCIRLNTLQILSQSKTFDLKFLQKITLNQNSATLLIDDLHLLCGSDNLKNSAILSEFLDNHLEIKLVATANEVENVHSLLRRPGRLDLEHEISIPSVAELADIFEREVRLSGIFSHLPNNFSYADLALKMSGWVYADVMSLIRELENLAQKFGLGSTFTLNQIEQTLKKINSSAVREITIKIPNVKWSDIGGYDQVKNELKKLVEWPIKHKHLYEKLNVKPPRGILLYGPPGCSKTMMAKAVANEAACNFISIKGSELFKKYVGESEKSVRQVFIKARRAAPCVIFFDEIDALAVTRSSGAEAKSGNSVSDRVIASLLTELDGVDELDDVFVIAATNRPDIVDPALLRPGRFDKKVLINLPDAAAKLKILELNLNSLPNFEKLRENFDQLIQKTANFSGSEIVSLCNLVKIEGITQMVENPDKAEAGLEISDFVAMCDKIKPVTDQQKISFYENFEISH